MKYFTHKLKIYDLFCGCIDKDLDKKNKYIESLDNKQWYFYRTFICDFIENICLN